jgi:hypothetical protein
VTSNEPTSALVRDPYEERRESYERSATYPRAKPPTNVVLPEPVEVCAELSARLGESFLIEVRCEQDGYAMVLMIHVTVPAGASADHARTAVDEVLFGLPEGLNVRTVMRFAVPVLVRDW